MQTLLKYLWITLAVTLFLGYSHWLSDYNQSLNNWEPVVVECSNHGGFMNAEGICDHNQ